MTWLPFLKKKEKNQIVVKNFNNKAKNSQICLMCFHGNIKKQIINYFNEQFLTKGQHIKHGGISSSNTILSLIALAGGAISISTTSSKHLYIATASPDHLMKIGNGVGSAILKNGRIIGHAPFVPASNALIPVVAPLMAFQVISTITILDNFNLINQKLDNIQKSIDRIIRRNEATFVGEINSVVNRITDIENRLKINKGFTNDMIIRLALIEDKINSIFERYSYLYSNLKLNNKNVNTISTDDINFKNLDAYMTLITSILDIKVDQLRLKLAIQENPAYAEIASRQFKKKIERYSLLWQNIKKDISKIHDIHDQIKNTIEHMNWWQKHVPSWLGGKRDNYIELNNKATELNNLIKNDIITEQIKKIENPDYYKNHNKNFSLIYWKENNTVYSYHSNDIIIRNAA